MYLEMTVFKYRISHPIHGNMKCIHHQTLENLIHCPCVCVCRWVLFFHFRKYISLFPRFWHAILTKPIIGQNSSSDALQRKKKKKPTTWHLWRMTWSVAAFCRGHITKPTEPRKIIGFLLFPKPWQVLAVQRMCDPMKSRIYCLPLETSSPVQQLYCVRYYGSCAAGPSFPEHDNQTIIHARRIVISFSCIFKYRPNNTFAPRVRP